MRSVVGGRVVQYSHTPGSAESRSGREEGSTRWSPTRGTVTTWSRDVRTSGVH